MATHPTDRLASLHTALVDAREGYRKAIEKGENAAFVADMRSVDALHETAHAEVHRILSARGAVADDDGSFMGSVHKAVISVRAAVAGLDEGSLDAFASGEERNLDVYDEAIGEETDAGVRATLARHRDALAAKVADLKRRAA